ncbi:PqqD family protein [Pannus brasiliensis CCIBt3594]|uniref:PqqD family protein n=1 Tax=Pannus brasiliensis CCIBt3594 TaxID=1427578 RepID=A0AAW9QPP9_9CHRO
MTAEISLQQKVSLSTEVLLQHLGGKSVLLDLKSELYFTQNEIATQMLLSLTESDSIQTAYNRLLEEYDVDPEKCKKDLLEFIERLVNAELVEISDPSTVRK